MLSGAKHPRAKRNRGGPPVKDGEWDEKIAIDCMRFARRFPIGDPIGIERMRPIDIAHSRSLGMTAVLGTPGETCAWRPTYSSR